MYEGAGGDLRKAEVQTVGVAAAGLFDRRDLTWWVGCGTMQAPAN